jgi:hypothetical protein
MPDGATPHLDPPPSDWGTRPTRSAVGVFGLPVLDLAAVSGRDSVVPRRLRRA